VHSRKIPTHPPVRIDLEQLRLLSADALDIRRNCRLNYMLRRHSALLMRPLCTICGLVLALYIGGFIWCFDVFSSPVRNDAHGWLGPLIRGDTHSQDIGKSYDYQSDDLSYYRVFFPLCKLWLIAQGLA
jgi:hypothetical protein